MDIFKKWFFNVLLYAGLAFLLVYLLRFDYVDFAELKPSAGYILLSLVFLFAGFYLSGASWWKTLRVHDIDAGLSEAVCSHGLPVFAKYIPGKVWVVLGRATRVSREGSSLKTTTFISLKEQFIFAWTGLLISLLPLWLLYGPGWFPLLVTAIFSGLTLVSFSDHMRRLFAWILGRVSRQAVEIPVLRLAGHAGVFLFCAATWIAWMLGFYFFVRAFLPDVSFMVAFAFPLSVTLGLLALIMPGGLGVREGALAGFMHVMGLPLEFSLTLVVLARLWFISGEVFIFAFSAFSLIKKQR
jgi:glycosyltransferase 2 family protein